MLTAARLGGALTTALAGVLMVAPLEVGARPLLQVGTAPRRSEAEIHARYEAWVAEHRGRRSEAEVHARYEAWVAEREAERLAVQEAMARHSPPVPRPEDYEGPLGHVRVLEEVVAAASSAGQGFYHDPTALLARLEQHGHRAPLDVRARHGAYSDRELGVLKRDSVKGNIPSAVLLAYHYHQKALFDREPDSVGEVLVDAPGILIKRDQAHDYARRARKSAERLLEKLRRR